MKADALQMDMFDRAPKYPFAPAARDIDTSRGAAPKQERVSELHRQCIQILMAHPSTADEVAKALKESVLLIRPRIAELRRQGKIRDTGNRRKNESGKSAAVWGLA